MGRRVDLSGRLGRLDLRGRLGRLELYGRLGRLDLDGRLGRLDLRGRLGRLELGGRLGRPGSWLFWIGMLVVVTVGLVSVRDNLDQAHATLVYLLVVLGGSTSGGRALGFTLACACFLLIDYFLQTPFDTFTVDKTLDWLVLVAFLVTATVAAQLLGRANAEADAARRRAEEIDRLAALGAETLSAGFALDALAAVAKVIRETTGAAECQIYVAGAAPGAAAAAGAFHAAAVSRAGGTSGAGVAAAALAAGAAEPKGAAVTAGPAVGAGAVGAEGAAEMDVAAGSEEAVAATVAWVAEQRRVATERLDGTPVRTSATAGSSAALDAALSPARAVLLPLVVHDRAVGVLRLADAGGLSLGPARRRILDALSYYAALGIERVHLVAEAEHAEALRETDRLKDALLASVSHDLRTPLTTIKALAHDIAGGGDERAAVIEQQSDRLNHMVADLLDLSRLNAGSVALNTEINAAEDLVGAAMQQAAGALQGREVRADLPLHEPMPLGRFDFVHALRALVNLIENAAKYSPREAPIDIAIRADGDMLAIAVADRGPGVGPAERERIFEPFYRPAGVSPDGARAGGAGLGLAIARRLAQAQGGTLTYEDRPGGGANFTLRLPAAPLLDETPAPAPPDGFAVS
jgi:two-component system sensor histidine kinase KdpD